VSAALYQKLQAASDEAYNLMIEHAKVRAENASLREALFLIIDLKPEDMYHATENSHAAAIARSALKD
jgi:hypothetical protein